MSAHTAKKGRTTSKASIMGMDSQSFEEPKTENNINDLLKMCANIYVVLRQEYGVENHALDLRTAVDEPDPKGWKQAMKSKNKAFWLSAVYEEMQTIIRIGVFTLTQQLVRLFQQSGFLLPSKIQMALSTNSKVVGLHMEIYRKRT